MGRITAYDQDGRMVADFDKSGYDLMWMRQGYEDEIESLMAENAKLRELVNGLEYCVQGHICDCCPLYDPSDTNHRRCESLEHELGIEVPE